MRLRTTSYLIAAALGSLALYPAASAWAQTSPAVAKAAAPVAAAAAQKTQKHATVEGITEYRLANGLRVLLAPDASKPTTTVNITYLVGSRHENYGETGMAHLLEHMVFKGTPSRGNIMQELGKRGMQFNGTTFYDRTNYFETFPASEENLTWALEMEADRMVNSYVARKDLETEFSVVRNEMESGENNPQRSLWQAMAATAYDWHNYGKSTIGARTDVEGVKIENLQAFYRAHYQPDNAVLLVSGKFDAAKTLAQIEQVFGAIPRPTRQLQPTYTLDPVQNGAREVSVNRVGDTQLAAVLYHTPASSHADSAAVAALAEILGNSPNGRLHKLLVEGKKAVSVAPWNFELAEPGYLMFMAELGKDQKLAEARKALQDALENLKKNPITEAELKRAKASWLSDFDKTLNDPQRLGVQLSESIASGDWRLFFLARDRMEALTVKDVQRVAENYFKESNRTYGQFVPTKAPDRAVLPAPVDVAKLVEGYQGRAAVAEGENFDVSPANIDKRTLRTALPNGMKLALTAKKTRGETVQGVLRLDFGDAKSLFGQATASGLTAELLSRGTAKLSRAELAAKLDELKARLNVSGSGQSVNVQFDTVRKNLPALLELLRDVLRTPSFPAQEFELAVKESLTAIDAQRSEPQALASQALSKARDVYPKGDVRAFQSFDESAAQLKALKLEDVKRFWSQFYGADNAKLALVGDFDNAEVQAQLKTLFGDWKSKSKYARLSSESAPAKPGAIQLEAPDKANAFYIALLPLTLKDDAPDYVPLAIVNKVLGGGVKSRLLDRLRQKEGISYGAGSQLSAGSFEPVGAEILFAIYAPQNLERLKTGVSEELSRLVKDGISETELVDAKKALLEQLKIGRAQDVALAAGLVSQLHTGRTMAFTAEREAQIEKITLDEVNKTLRRAIDPAQFLHIYAGDFAGAAKKAAEAAAAAAPAKP
ncbi:insulinase family protein [Paucibacter sp. KBW04]|uniref:M16 family metallopeptidase n=1 Tax=Paucibacter sp. KBW04 TaxID=2153361 RepID=UPI000F55F1C3|nr:pitrilysin family protein [Paucibacter sp. KBW04]RQO55901.1 insulinase family protein [Paucibacter sp. KBW04]